MVKSKHRLKRGDIVLIILGEDRGKKGKILSIDKKKDFIIVEGARLAKKHMRPRKQGEQGGIIEKEAPIHISNLKLVCPKCGKSTRVQKSILENKKRVRVCNKCGEFID
ncbi:50S ribosomal protein L24 [candidate division WOR-3 bacterium]|nr:50S ribosomal protein L24 [candidate division WOR-3 bacterium]